MNSTIVTDARDFTVIPGPLSSQHCAVVITVYEFVQSCGSIKRDPITTRIFFFDEKPSREEINRLKRELRAVDYDERGGLSTEVIEDPVKLDELRKFVLPTHHTGY